MERKRMVCIECPKSCVMDVGIDNGRIASVENNECPKGRKYAKQEIENPARVVTSTVLAAGLALKMVPVKTDRPVPKQRVLEAMQEIRKVRLTRPVALGEVVVSGMLGLGINLVATRTVPGGKNERQV